MRDRPHPSARAPLDWRAPLRASLAIFALLLARSVAAQEAAGAASEQDETAEVTCESCHGDDPVLPDAHPPVAGMSMSACTACHQPGSPLALPAGMQLDHHHYMAGLDCASCHDDPEAPAATAGTELCLACHGPLEALGALTADVEPTNPHLSPHGPPYAECGLCHQIHTESENFCAQCHDFEGLWTFILMR